MVYAPRRRRYMLACAVSMMAGCTGSSSLPISATVGESPTLVAPDTAVVPTVNVVSAIGWPQGGSPTAAAGLKVAAFAHLDHPRWLYVLPNGDVLVAETNAPPRPKDDDGIRGKLMQRYQAQAGGAAPSANRISLLRDANGDGLPEQTSVFLSGLNAPFGMALVGSTLYIANSDAVVSVPYQTGQTSVSTTPTTVLPLPAGERNHHWTKNIIASPDGLRLYIAIGSNSNAAEHGLAEEVDRAELWELDLQTGRHRTFARGLRNPVGMAWEPSTNALWTAVNERDELGHDLVPDYMTAVKDGAFYGWPFTYFGDHVDERVKEPRPDLPPATVPDYALGAHTASLGLAYSTGNALGPQWQRGMFVGQHGSWNRKPRSGYKVIFVPFVNGRPNGAPADVLSDFVLENGDAMGRPVGVAIDTRGGLLVADDVGNVVWRVTAVAGTTAAPR